MHKIFVTGNLNRIHDGGCLYIHPASADAKSQLPAELYKLSSNQAAALAVGVKHCTCTATQ